MPKCLLFLKNQLTWLVVCTGICTTRSQQDHSKIIKSLIETVRATKDFLNEELGKYESWEELPNKSIKQLFIDEKGYSPEGRFKQCKKDGAGQTTILKFLGEPWKDHENMTENKALRQTIGPVHGNILLLFIIPG
ncbi:MAG: hypothetical protein A2Y71_03015 [Bacteroidetes bacterium RBG_13_42_15]|nr:MAG: hypothetical protein A2Y71_03015 [Bacteroidetes bacterium RBG_13_42_15]